MLSLGLVLIVVLGAGLFYLHPRLMLPALVCTLPFQRLGAFPLDPIRGFPIIQPIQVVGAALIAAALALAVRDKRWRERPLLSIAAALAAVLLCGLVAAAQVHYFQVWRDLVSAVLAVALCLSTGLAVRYTSLRQLWLTLCAVSIVIGLFGLYQFVGDIAGLPLSQTGLLGRYGHLVFGFPRIQATMAEPLFYASFLLIPLFVGASMLLHTQRDRMLGWMVLGVLAINFTLTLSRGAFLAAVVALPVWLWLAKHKLGLALRGHWKRLVLFALGIVLVTTGALAATSAALGKDPLTAPRRFLGLVTTKANETGSLSDRLVAQQQALAVVHERPWFGLGIGGYSFRLEGYPVSRTQNDRVAINNEFLELLVEVGIVGLGSYLIFIMLMLKNAWLASRHATGSRKAWLVGITAAVVATLVQYQSFSGFFIYHIWVLFGLAIGLGLSTAAEPTAESLV